VDNHTLEQNKRKKTHIEYPMFGGKLACGGSRRGKYYIWTMFDLVTCKKCRKYIKAIKNMKSGNTEEAIAEICDTKRYSVYD